MILFWFKLLSTPMLVGVLSLCAHRFGARLAGLLAAFPVTSGPILAYAMYEHGSLFASLAALATLTGLLAVAAYAVAYCAVVRLHAPRVLALAVATLAYAITAAALRLWHPSVSAALSSVVLCLLVTLPTTSAPAGAKLSLKQPPLFLFIRIVVTTTFILAVTAVAGYIGPTFSGLMSTFPLITTVLLMFSHRPDQEYQVYAVLRGVLAGSFASATFYAVVAAMIRESPPLLTFATATFGAVVVGSLTMISLKIREWAALERADAVAK